MSRIFFLDMFLRGVAHRRAMPTVHLNLDLLPTYIHVFWPRFSARGQVFFAVFFSFNFVFELLLSKNRWAFVMSILGIVDLVTIVPVFVALVTEPLAKSPTGFVRMYRVLMLARVRKSAGLAEKNVSDSCCFCAPWDKNLSEFARQCLPPA